MSKNIFCYIYVCVVSCIVLIPVLTMNHDTNVKSMIDNSYLPEFPEILGNRDMPAEMNQYINKRIGFREECIYLYEAAVDKIFHELAVPGYMYGKNGNIMGSVDRYIADYQHLNLQEDKAVIENFAEWLTDVNQYLEEKDIVFLYFLPTDKKTIYPECMPNTIHVYGNRSRTDMLLEQIEDVPYIYPKKEFLEAKKQQQIYNLKYDVLHWNDLGSFIGHKLVDDYLQQKCTGIVPLSVEQYELSYENTRCRLAASNFYVYDKIPTYSLIETEQIQDISTEDSFGLNGNNSFEHYINNDLPNAPTILILHDSYIAGGAKYYIGRYHEVISVDNNNHEKLQALVEHYQPDIVLFEAVERTLSRNSYLKEWDSISDTTNP